MLDGDEYVIAYVRVCYGMVTCEYPEIGGRLVYSERISDDERNGHFASREQKIHCLTKVSEVLRALVVSHL